MLPELRRTKMLEQIQRNGSASVAELARDFSVSQITVHRDLDALTREGLVERVHGGARPARAVTQVETDWGKRLRLAVREKELIAERALEWIEDGSTIFVDSSTTALALARQLERRPPRSLTLVTNSPAIALELHAEPIHVIVTPGEVDQTLRSIGGRWTAEFLAGLNFHTAFVSAAGVTLEHGLTTTRRALADTLGAARSVSARTFGLIDSSKFGRSSLLPIVRAEELDALVVDDGLPAETLAAYRRARVNVVVAERARPALSATT